MTEHCSLGAYTSEMHLLTVLAAGSPRWGGHQGQVWWGPSSWLADSLLLTWWGGREARLSGVSSWAGCSPIRGLSLLTSSQRHHLPMAPSAKDEGVDLWIQGTQFSPQHPTRTVMVLPSQLGVPVSTHWINVSKAYFLEAHVHISCKISSRTPWWNHLL